MISDKILGEYVQEAMVQIVLRAHEDEILGIMKRRQEANPSERHDAEWLEYSQVFGKRRYGNCGPEKTI